jgi:hypothetical protein
MHLVHPSLGLGRLCLQASSFVLGSSMLGFLEGGEDINQWLWVSQWGREIMGERGKRETNSRGRRPRDKLCPVHLLSRTENIHLETPVSFPCFVSFLRGVRWRVDERRAGLTSESSTGIIRPVLTRS